MATFNKVNGFVEHLAEKVHNLGSDTLKIALSNTAPGAETPDPSVATADCILANVTEIAYTYASARTVSISASAQSGGTFKLTLTDLTITASGGAIGPFRYVYLYNDTPTSPADPLIGYFDYGSSITIADGEELLIDFDATNGVLTLA
jgi:hypothetical protein